MSSVVAFCTACLLLSLGFHPVFSALVISRSMYFTSPFHPLPPFTPPVVCIWGFRFIFCATICAISVTVIQSLFPTLYMSVCFPVFWNVLWMCCMALVVSVMWR